MSFRGQAPFPVAVPPARHETIASYLARLARLHGLYPGDAQDQATALAEQLPGAGMFDPFRDQEDR